MQRLLVQVGVASHCTQRGCYCSYTPLICSFLQIAVSLSPIWPHFTFSCWQYRDLCEHRLHELLMIDVLLFFLFCNKKNSLHVSHILMQILNVPIVWWLFWFFKLVITNLKLALITLISYTLRSLKRMSPSRVKGFICSSHATHVNAIDR